MDKMTWSFPGALFVAAGGYHHHIGLNVWAAGAQSPELRTLGSSFGSLFCLMRRQRLKA